MATVYFVSYSHDKTEGRVKLFCARTSQSLTLAMHLDIYIYIYVRVVRLWLCVCVCPSVRPCVRAYLCALPLNVCMRTSEIRITLVLLFFFIHPFCAVSICIGKAERFAYLDWGLYYGWMDGWMDKRLEKRAGGRAGGGDRTERTARPLFEFVLPPWLPSRSMPKADRPFLASSTNERANNYTACRQAHTHAHINTQADEESGRQSYTLTTRL